MIAYVFWHRRREDADAAEYEEANIAFHRSLARSAPVGMRGSAMFRVPEAPWLDGPGYEDWYLVEDFTALGVLNEAAVGRGHRTVHDRAARRLLSGTAGLYTLIEGAGMPAGRTPPASSPAIWVERPPGSPERSIGELLGDGMGAGEDDIDGSLWRRLLVLGPAPEYCLQAPDAPQGVAATRLPEGWSAHHVEREQLFAS